MLTHHFTQAQSCSGATQNFNFQIFCSSLCGRSTDFYSPSTPSSAHPQAPILLLLLPGFSGPDLCTADSYLPFRSQIKCCLLWDAFLDSKTVIFNILLLYFVFLLALIVPDSYFVNIFCSLVFIYLLLEWKLCESSLWANEFLVLEKHIKI